MIVTISMVEISEMDREFKDIDQALEIGVTMGGATRWVCYQKSTKHMWIGTRWWICTQLSCGWLYLVFDEDYVIA